ncbi:MAG: DinB family protein [Flexibacter sp. CG_4_10_14_3_um_filter_32_15]|nr:MAG: DinB family protein [Flexibacter sp. CG_4_10_14_3_um_filter_32_15]
MQLLKTTRTNFLNLLNEFSLEQINQIPQGFSNNLIWNFGHLVVTQQLLCYKLSGNKMYSSDEILNKYRKGTKPEAHATQAEVDELKKLAFDLVDKFEKDYTENKAMFEAYTEYPTSYNYTLKNIEDAIHFNNTHEGVHYGYALALRKAIV